MKSSRISRPGTTNRRVAWDDHMPTMRRRVLADELALAADVFDVEPLPLDDPLLGRHNVVHTLHNAGRTRDSNEHWAEALLVPFGPLL